MEVRRNSQKMFEKSVEKCEEILQTISEGNEVTNESISFYVDQVD